MCKKLIYLASFVLVLGLVLTSVAEAVDPDHPVVLFVQHDSRWRVETYRRRAYCALRGL